MSIFCSYVTRVPKYYLVCIYSDKELPLNHVIFTYLHMIRRTQHRLSQIAEDEVKTSRPCYYFYLIDETLYSETTKIICRNMNLLSRRGYCVIDFDLCAQLLCTTNVIYRCE